MDQGGDEESEADQAGDGQAQGVGGALTALTVGIAGGQRSTLVNLWLTKVDRASLAA